MMKEIKYTTELEEQSTKAAQYEREAIAVVDGLLDEGHNHMFVMERMAMAQVLATLAVAHRLGMYTEMLLQ